MQEQEEQLSAAYAAAADRQHGDLGDMQAKVAGFEQEIERRLQHIGALEQGALALRSELETMGGRLEEIRQEASGNVTAMARKFETDLQADLRRRRVAIDEQLTGWQSELRGNLSQISDQTRAEYEQLVRNQSGELNSVLASLRENASARIGGVREDIERTGAQLELRIQGIDKLTETMEEDMALAVEKLQATARETLERETNRVQSQISEEISRIRHETESATGSLQNQMASRVEIIGETMRSSKDEISNWKAHVGQLFVSARAETEGAIQGLTQQIDLRSQEFHDVVEQARAELGELQRNAITRMGAETGQLLSRLNEIEKRQRAFVEQTKLFDRADQLKEHLRSEIEELRAQIGAIDEQRAGVREIDLNLSRTRKLMRDVSDRLARFHSERRRIDRLESSYGKLMSLSERVDSRLEQITADSDSLQAIQVRLRSIEALEKSIEERYERLERKRGIVDATNAGIDKSFQDLELVEQRLQKANGDLDALPKQIKKLTERLNMLANSSHSAEKAAEMIAGVKQMLGGIEERSERLQATREWLGRTETRLMQISNQTEERIKLLKALVERTPGEKLPNNNGELVVKLAHQGWTVEEIAHQTKVSRGEIEVILGMAGT